MDDIVLDKIFKPKTKNLFLTTINNNNRIRRIIQELKSISKDKLGKSGAQVFYHSDKIVKMYPFKRLDYRVSKDQSCIHLSNILLEMINNFVFNNLHLFLSEKGYETFMDSGFKKYIIKVKDFGFYHPELSSRVGGGKSYIIQQKIGYHKCVTLYDLIKNGDNIDQIIPKLDKYFQVLKFLNQKLGFFHTDLTCKNVFLKKYRESYLCMVSDLDKGGLKLGKINLFPSESSLVDKIGQNDYLKPFKNVYQFRYSCQRNIHFCDKFKPYHYDRITLLMDIYILAMKGKGITYELEKFIMDQLDLDEQQFELFDKSIRGNYFLMKAKSTNLGFHINYSMYKFCNMLKRG